MRLIINHPHSKLQKLNEDDGLLWDRIEDFLTANKFTFAPLEPDTGTYEGIIVWLPDVGPRGHYYPKRDEEIKALSDLGKFLFEELKLSKNCLHFVFAQECVNGEGSLEKCWEAIDEVIYEELTGQVLEEQFRPMTISRQEIKEEVEKSSTKRNKEYWVFTEGYEADLERLLLQTIGDPYFKTKKVSTKEIVDRINIFAPEGYYPIEKVEYALQKLASYGLIKQT